MNIKERYSLSAICPVAYQFLHEVTVQETWYIGQGTGHPLSIYSASLSALEHRLGQLLDYVEILASTATLTEITEENWNKKLEHLVDSALDSVVEHAETCEKVIRAFFQKANSPEANKTVSDFNAATKQYVEKFSIAVNKIKHNQRHIRIVSCVGFGICVPGYFVAAPQNVDGIGPDKNVHKDAPSYSVNRELRFHICGVHWISYQLKKQLLKQANKNGWDIVARDPVNLPLWSKFVERVATSPNIFLPWENKLPVPQVFLNGDEVKIEFPSRHYSPINKYLACTITAQFQGDGQTVSFDASPIYGYAKNQWG